jgi:hypothetical protein
MATGETMVASPKCGRYHPSEDTTHKQQSNDTVLQLSHVMKRGFEQWSVVENLNFAQSYKQKGCLSRI